MIIKLYNQNKEIINYLIFGILTAIVSLTTYYALVLTILNPNNPIELQIANIISWIVCVTFAYFTNRKYVFISQDKHILKEACRFYLSRLAVLLLDMLLMYILVSRLHYNDKIMKIAIQIIITAANYILSKLLIFKQTKKSNN